MLTRTPIPPAAIKINEIVNGKTVKKTIPLWTNPCQGKPFQTKSIQLGQGSYGTVFQAYCGNIDTFAIKWIPAKKAVQLDLEIELQNLAAPDYARPIYEKLKYVQGAHGEHVKYGYVTDRLDITLYEDLFSLTNKQLVLARKHYETIFKRLLEISQ